MNPKGKKIISISTLLAFVVFSISCSFTGVKEVKAETNWHGKKGEILNQRWNDIDFSELYIYIKESKSNPTRKIRMNSAVTATSMGIKRECEFMFMNQWSKS